jgi:L-fucose isomerase-like protein
VRLRWGVSIVDADLPAAIERYATVTDAPHAVPVHLGARRTSHEPDRSDVVAASRFESVLHEVVAAERLDAVSVRCFDLLASTHTSGCLALSALNDAGVIAGCEGDVASTVALLWMRLLTGQLGWMANPAAADPATGVIELAHCTVALSLVSGYELDTHFESGLGIGIAGDLPPGPVTVLRLGGKDLEQLWCVDGTALPTTRRPGRCRTQLDVHVASDAVADLLERPLGNHLVVIAGHHAEQVRRWWRTMLAPVPTSAR